MEPEVIDILKLAAWVSDLDAPVLFILALLTGYYRVWVWGHQYAEMTVDRDFWRAQALAIAEPGEEE